MPVIIRELNDDEAVIAMADSNLQRETVLPSEKAWAYHMKLEALNHRGERTGNLKKMSVEIVAEQTGESKSQIYRSIRLTELVPGLSDLVDAMAKYEATPSLPLSSIIFMQWRISNALLLR